MRDDSVMRTTLDIDDDVLQAAKELARVRGKTAGQMVSELARHALTPTASRRVRNGVPVLPRRAAGQPKPTMKLVNELRDES
jgi:Arc/MetJ family transcription regulator